MKHDPVEKGGGDKKSYATKAKVEFAVRMARDVAGIDKIGGLTFGSDGSVTVLRAEEKTRGPSVEDEIAEWKSRRRGN